MRKNVMLIALATIGLASCKGGFKQAEGGLLYDIHTDKSGPTIKTGDFMSLNLVLKTEGDSVVYSTYETGRPVLAPMPKEQKKGDITTGFLLLSEGDSATFKMNIDSVFKKGQPKPPGIKGKYIVYNVKVEKVIPRGNLSDVVFQGRISEYVKAQAEVLKKAEPAKIKKYADDNKLKTSVTPSGLNYVITTPGSGPTIAKGDTAVVNYAGTLLNGKMFDSSLKENAAKVAAYTKQPADPRRVYAPMHLAVGEGRVIRGWDEGLLLLNKGAKATFVIPSELGWGEQGAPPMIPAFAVTVFTVEVVDIIHPDPNAPKTTAPQPPAMR
jgi:FKBP-type peptidyl-prolyl cis-trans isomerase FkpA